MSFKEQVMAAFQAAQEQICQALEQADGVARFSREPWTHQGGGGGITRVIESGHVFEKGGVNFSAVEGELPTFLKSKVSEKATRFFASGVSIVIHPFNPWVPIIHMNVRYFQTDAGDEWFGGGIDLTPIYVQPLEAGEFHRKLQATCNAVSPDFYSKFKTWADEYFFLEHRNETRGVGGVFYDYLKPDDQHSAQQLLQFAISLCNTFTEVYVPLVEKHKNAMFSELNKEWQYIRRGRYVEFNLVYDRGTRFGLETKGRIESILMSLPTYAAWKYNYRPEEGSPEAETLAQLKKGIDWIAYV